MTDIINNINTYRNHANKGYLLLIDQTKAFDRVNHNYLFKTIEKMGITGDFLDMTKLLYDDITSQIEVNGTKTEKIQIKRGVRQGCPYSMILFVLSTVPLIQMIKDSSEIQGHRTRLNNQIKIQSYADDTTIIIENPQEIKEVNKIFEKHSRASEAQINNEKTQIFRLSNTPPQNETEQIKGNIESEITLLGAKFCTNKRLETERNLQKAIKKITKWNESYNDHISLVGKILNINTYIYTIIFNNASLINTNSKDFDELIKQISIYLQRIKSRDTYDKVSKGIDEHGLNLINVKERIETLQMIELIEAVNKMPETDNLMYEIGIHQQKLFEKQLIGPKAEETPDKIHKLIKKITPKMEQIRNYKKRHKKVATKNIQAIIFEKEKVKNFNEILIADEPKLISINYKIKHEILPIMNSIPCLFCKGQPESIEHIMVNCSYLHNLRRQVNIWLRAINKNDLNKDKILNMYDVTDILENQIITRYKFTIWKMRNIIKSRNKPQNVNDIIQILDKDIRFYIKYIHPNNDDQSKI